MKKIEADYTKGNISIGIPLLVFLLIWLGLGYFILWKLGWSISEWKILLIFAGTLFLGLIAAVVLYRLIIPLATKKEEMELNNTTLTWKIGKKHYEIDFSKPYFATIYAIGSNLATGNIYKKTSIEIKSEDLSIPIYIDAFGLNDVLNVFNDFHFVSMPNFVMKEILGYGFTVNAADPTAKDFIASLLKVLWNTRHKNSYFNIYQKFPWDRIPQPEFTYMKEIKKENQSPEEIALIKKIESEFINVLPNSQVRVTPDYLVGYKDDSIYIMPIGYIQLHEKKGSVSADSHSYYLVVQGKDINNNPIEVEFNWYGSFSPPNDYYEANWVDHFADRIFVEDEEDIEKYADEIDFNDNNNQSYIPKSQYSKKQMVNFPFYLYF